MIIKETIHVDIKNNVFTKTDQITNLEMITNLIVITIVTRTPSQYIKEGMINITTRNLNIEIKITIRTKGKEGMIQVILMKEAKCLMKATKNLKLCKLDQTTLITKERNQLGPKIMMIDTRTTTISKDL